MPITVEDVARFPGLQVRVVAGRSGLGGEVRWAHVIELADPVEWLRGGELVLTVGLGLPKTGEERRGYVRRLHGAGCVGLGFAPGTWLEEVPAEVVAEADAVGLPLLLVEGRTPFVAVVEAVADLHARARLAAQHRVLAAQDAMARAALSGGAVSVLRELAGATGGEAALADGWGVVRESSGPARPWHTHLGPAPADRRPRGVVILPDPDDPDGPPAAAPRGAARAGDAARPGTAPAGGAGSSRTGVRPGAGTAPRLEHPASGGAESGPDAGGPRRSAGEGAARPPGAQGAAAPPPDAAPAAGSGGGPPGPEEPGAGLRRPASGGGGGTAGPRPAASASGVWDPRDTAARPGAGPAAPPAPAGREHPDPGGPETGGSGSPAGQGGAWPQGTEGTAVRLEAEPAARPPGGIPGGGGAEAGGPRAPAAAQGARPQGREEEPASRPGAEVVARPFGRAPEPAGAAAAAGGGAPLEEERPVPGPGGAGAGGLHSTAAGVRGAEGPAARPGAGSAAQDAAGGAGPGEGPPGGARPATGEAEAEPGAGRAGAPAGRRLSGEETAVRVRDDGEPAKAGSGGATVLVQDLAAPGAFRLALRCPGPVPVHARMLANHAATLLAAELHSAAQARRVRLRERSRALAALLRGRPVPVPPLPAPPLEVAVLPSLRPDVLMDAVADVLPEVLGDAGAAEAVAAAPAGDALAVVLPARWRRRAGGVLLRALAGAEGAPSACGGCSARGPEGLRAAVRRARREAAAGPGYRHVEDADPLARLGRSLGGEADEFVASVLGRLREHDARNGTELVPSLRAYFEHGGVEAAARALDVHRNTLRTRLRTAERLSGRALTGRGRLELELALSFETFLED